MPVVRNCTAGRWFAPDSGAPACDAATCKVLAMVAKEHVA